MNHALNFLVTDCCILTFYAITVEYFAEPLTLFVSYKTGL